MKRAFVAIAVSAAAFFCGAYLGAKLATPCVCVYAGTGQVN